MMEAHMGEIDDGTSAPTPVTGRELFLRRAELTKETPSGGVGGGGRPSKRDNPIGRKYNPERLRKFLDRLVKFPRVGDACAFSGISYSTLRYYLVKSEAGRVGDGMDLTYGEETKRFHLHYADAIQAGVQMVEDEYMQRAINGYYEVLHDKGRVIYQVDPALEGLGLTGPDAYLLDEDGRPIPERIKHQDPETMLAVLRAWRRDVYGRHEKIDVSVRGGVMVVGTRAKSSAEIDQLEKSMLEEPIDVEFREVEDE
jgi:hypothetical protein